MHLSQHPQSSDLGQSAGLTQFAVSSPPKATSTFRVESTLARFACRQLGLFTVEQALRAGISAQQVHQRRKARMIYQLFRSVYRIAAVRPSWEQRILGGWLASGTNVCIARRSAAHVHGLPIGPPIAGADVELVAWKAPGTTRSRISGLEIRRSVLRPNTQSWCGAQITTPAQTVCDLAAVLPTDRLARCIDHVVAHRLATVDSMTSLTLRKPTAGFKGRASLLALLQERSDGRPKHRSMKEQRIAGWLRNAGLGQFTPNFLIAEAGNLEVDFAWERSCVSLEVSPFFTHGSEAKQQRDIQRRRLLAPTRWVVIEATDSDVKSEAAFAPTIALLRKVIGDRARRDWSVNH